MSGGQRLAAWLDVPTSRREVDTVGAEWAMVGQTAAARKVDGADARAGCQSAAGIVARSGGSDG